MIFIIRSSDFSPRPVAPRAWNPARKQSATGSSLDKRNSDGQNRILGGARKRSVMAGCRKRAAYCARYVDDGRPGNSSPLCQASHMLDSLENQTIYIVREAHYHFRRMAMLWSIGKDSTTLLWMVRKAFFGKIPFPILHIDTGYKFPEIYAFRDEYAKKWDLDLRIVRNEQAIAAGVNPHTEKFGCCSALKTEALRQAIEKFKFQALLLGIRRDEHGIRSKGGNRYLKLFLMPDLILILLIAAGSFIGSTETGINRRHKAA